MSVDTKNWFDVDRKGLAKLIERRGKIWLLHELIANAWDADGTTQVEVTLEPEVGKPFVTVIVTDDAPNGFADLAHSWTLFAESNRKGDANKRGRFNLGEKLVLALCREASIVTTTAAVMFDGRGRTTMKARRTTGSAFEGTARVTRAELDEIQAGLQRLIPPAGIATWINKVQLPMRWPIKTIETTLPTEIGDDEGILRRSARKCEVRIYEVLDGETAMLYEMGIPVVETGDKWHVEVNQKVPLNMERDNVTPSYLATIRTLVVNALHEQLTPADANATFVNEALADKDATAEAVNTALTIKYGTQRAVFDATDPEANMLLTSKGYTLIHGPQLTKPQWDNVRRHTAAQPSGRIAPTAVALFSPDGKDVWVPREKWTEGMVSIASYSERVAAALLGKPITVRILSDIKLHYVACYGQDELVFNLGKLGHKFFTAGPTDQLHQLLLHELAHDVCSNHLDAKYHDALCVLGAKLTRLALTQRSVLAGWSSDGAPASRGMS